MESVLNVCNTCYTYYIAFYFMEKIEREELSMKIGVMDSGVGGLTVIKELQKMLPNEEFIYYGDSANCPYGNKTKEEVIQLAERIIQFLNSKQVDIICIACNTISTVINELRANRDLPLLSIIYPVARFVALESALTQVGVIATVDTIDSKAYPIEINELNPNIAVFGQGSPRLAALIEQGNFTNEKISIEVKNEVDHLQQQELVQDVILGCTHYPIVENVFHSLYPSLHFINPAYYQALTVQKMALKQKLATAPKQITEFYTSGDTTTFTSILTHLGILTNGHVYQLSL